MRTLCALAFLLALLPAGCRLDGAGPLERALVFRPTRYPGGQWDRHRVEREDAWFEASDGVRLHGWFAGAEHPRDVVLYCHGNAGNVTGRDWVLHLYRDRLGASVLVFDYRGYGKSEGTPTEAGVLRDARAARRWLAQRAGVAEADVVVAGRSLGGAVAVDLAARDGARGLVLENTFTSLPDVAADLLPLLPVRCLMTMRFDALAHIREYHGPLLQTHGDADRVVPFSLGRRLFEAASGPKQFVAVPGGGHNDPPSREFVAALDRFLDGPCSPTPGP